LTGEQALRRSTTTSDGVSRPAVGRQAARRVRCRNLGRTKVCSSPSRPLLRFVRTGSGVGVDEGGCSPTRARARCACRSRGSGRQQAHRRLPQSRQRRAAAWPLTTPHCRGRGDAHLWRIRGRSACWPWHLLRADGGAPLGLREVLSSEASPGYLAGGVILGACWRARAMLVIAVSAIAAMPISAAVV